MDVPYLGRRENFWNVRHEIDSGCRRHHRVLRAPRDSHLDRDWTASTLFLHACLEPSDSKRGRQSIFPAMTLIERWPKKNCNTRSSFSPTRVHYSDGRNIGNRRTSWRRIKTETAWCGWRIAISPMIPLDSLSSYQRRRGVEADRAQLKPK
jgi:hypothetical protein